MEVSANHIDYQLPNEQKKVQNFLDSVDNCQNTKFCAGVLDISDVGCGMSTYFEQTAAFLLQMDPVIKKNNKLKNVIIYEVTGTQSGVGTSGVSLCWHSNEEYGTLNPEQISELHDWRITNGTNRGGLNSHKSKKGTKNANAKGNFNKRRHKNNAWNKLKPKVLLLFKAAEIKAK